MFRKHKYGLMIFSSLIIAVLIVALLAYQDAEFRYTMQDRISKFGSSAELTEIAVKVKGVTLKELLSDVRTTLNDSLMLINTDHLIEDDYPFDITEYNDTGVYMNSCITNAYAELSSEIRERFDEKLYISSAYRTAEEQAKQIAEEGDKAQSVGASEHQAGLAVDVYIMYYGGAAFLKHDAGQWVNSNCQDYGFIIRYPYYGKDETGISYEPWHLRYIGFPHAEIIAKSSLTLEGYLDSIKQDVFYSYESGGESWLIVRRSGEAFNIPEDYESAVISPDNCGGYILTFRV